jgi:splicing factor 3A subunit 1
MTLSAKTQDTQSKIIEQIIVLKDPPPEFEFLADAPSIMPLDIDCMKLTAQYVARNGQPFLSAVRSKESRNPMFDFLKPQHSHFVYFNRLVDQYTKVLLPPRDLLDKLRKESANRFGVLKDTQYRVEWQRAAQREKQKEDEIAEKERVAYAQIDWHDFVVVETVEYLPGEMGNFPPPTTPADVGARTLVQERIESGELTGIFDANGKLLIGERAIIEDESRVLELGGISQTLGGDQIRLAPPVDVSSTTDKNVDQVAMDEANSDDEKQQPQQPGKFLNQLND